MITLKKTTEMLKSYLSGDLKIQGAEGFDSISLNELLLTNENLWKVVIAARRWRSAPPGRESSEREYELAELLDALPKGE